MAGFLDEVKGGLLSNEQLEDLKRHFEDELRTEIPQAAQRTVERIKEEIKNKIKCGKFSVISQRRCVFGTLEGVYPNHFAVDFNDQQLEEMAHELQENGALVRRSCDEYRLGKDGSDGIRIMSVGMSVIFYGYETLKVETLTKEMRGFWGRKKIRTYQHGTKGYGLSDLGIIFVRSLMEQAQKEEIQIEIVCEESDEICGGYEERPVFLEKATGHWGVGLKIKYSITF